MRQRQVAGHFGEWLQGRLGPDGPVVLVTLPCAQLGVVARHRPGAGGFALAGAGLSTARARAFLRGLGLQISGRVQLAPCAQAGLGTGVSTASLVALAQLAGWDGPPEALARACVAAEGASDPLVFDAPERLLWASREGRALTTLPSLPRYEILGGFFGPPRRTDPRDGAFPDIADLLVQWQQARDLSARAVLASESAARTTRLRGPAQDPTAALARRLGALGWMRAHTGAARGLIFAPGTVPEGATAALLAAGLRGLHRFKGGER